MEDERRRTHRLPFFATAEVIAKGGHTGIAARANVHPYNLTVLEQWPIEAAQAKFGKQD